MDIDATNPNILYATMWRFGRKPWRFISGSDKTGVFRCTDGGRTWQQLSNGLADENRLYSIGMRLSTSIDGGRNWRLISASTHGDYHTVWVDPKNPSRIWQGQDGGIAVSYDRGETWEFVSNLAIGQFYQVFADTRDPFYYLSGGLQDNGSWTGPSRTQAGAIINDDWIMVSGGDGFHFMAQNPPYGAPITYYLKEKGAAKIEILDAAGKVVRNLGAVPQDAGLNRVTWDLRHQGPHVRRAPDPEAEAEGGGGGGGGRGRPQGRRFSLESTVRLTAGGQTLTRELMVRLDPTIPAAGGELRTQLEINLKLRDMQSSVNDALRSIDTFKNELDTSEKTVRTLDPQAAKILTALITERLQQLSSMELKLARPDVIPGYSMGARLVDRLAQLLGAIDRVLPAPTPYQVEHFNELKAEFLNDVGDVNGFIERQIPEINDLLKKNNAGAVMSGKSIETPASVR